MIVELDLSSNSMSSFPLPCGAHYSKYKYTSRYGK